MNGDEQAKLLSEIRDILNEQTQMTVTQWAEYGRIAMRNQIASFLICIALGIIAASMMLG